MATLAIPLMGGMIGSAMLPAGVMIAGTAVSGFSVGWTIGSLVNSAINSKGENVKGPRLSDLDPRISSHTRVLPRVYGTEVVDGIVIYARKIEEVTKKESSGKGGGGSAETYTYFWSFSVALCEGEKEVLKIWADNKLVYDATNPNHVNKYPGVITVYNGTETQEPSPLQEATEGAGNVPAYLGICYVDFTRLPLVDLGNKSVIITALVGDAVDNKVSDEVASYVTSAAAFCMHPNKQQILITKNGTIRRLTLTDRGGVQEEIEFGTLPSGYGQWDGGGPYQDTDGDYIYFPLSKSPFMYVGRINLETGEVERVSNSVGTITNTNGQMRCDKDGNIYVSRGDGITFGFKADLAIGEKMTGLTSWGTYNPLRLCQGLGLDMWAVATDHSAQQIRVQRYNRGELINDAFIIDTSLSADDIKAVFYHAPTGYLILGVDTTLFAIDPETELLIWSTEVGTLHSITSFLIAPYTCNSIYYYLGGYETSTRINLATGELVDSLDYDLWAGIAPGANGDEQFYDESTHSLILRDAGFWRILPLDRLNDGTQITAQSFLEDMSVRAGHDLADITATDFSGDMMSYALRERAPYRNYIEPVLGTLEGDVVESDWGIKFVKRTGTPIGTVDSDDLIFVGDKESDLVLESDTQEIELPYQIDFAYINPDTDYQNSLITVKRNNAACTTRELETFGTPLALYESQVKDLAPRLLRTRWIQRWSQEFKLPWKYLKYDATDVLAVNADANEHIVMITNMEWQIDMTMSCNSMSVKSSTYDIVGADQTELGYDPSVLEVPGATVFHFLDMPALRDQDLHEPLLPLAANGLYSAWRGCLIQKSTDLAEWSDFKATTIEAAIGKTTSALSDHKSTVWDRTNSLTVTFYDNGYTAPASSTEDALVADASINLMLIGDEIVQAVNVTLVDANTYTFDTFLRGRFGTEHETGNHTSGNRVVILNETTLSQLDRQTTDVGVSKYYRAISIGNATEITAGKNFTYTAGNLKPRTVVYVTSSRDGSDNVTINFVRRGRRKPLAFWSPVLEEDSEAYEVDVLDGPGGSVVRIITSVASGNGSVVTPGSQLIYYDADDITADGLTPGDTHYIKIYQLSATIGRGNTREDAV